MNTNKKSTVVHAMTQNRPLIERDSDAYKSKRKLAGPTVCPECNAVFDNGRWQWMAAPKFAPHELCPACHRIKDNFPAGYVILEGNFFNEHCEDIRRLIQNHAEHERSEHPLKRIMAIEHKDNGMLVTTTDTHLARGIGEALRHAYQGKLKIEHVSGESLVRVYWTH